MTSGYCIPKYSEARINLHGDVWDKSLHSVFRGPWRCLTTYQMKIIRNLSHKVLPPETPTLRELPLRNRNSLFLTLEAGSAFIQGWPLPGASPSQTGSAQKWSPRHLLSNPILPPPTGNIKKVTSHFRASVLSWIRLRKQGNWFLRSLWNPRLFPPILQNLTLSQFSTNNTESRKEF